MNNENAAPEKVSSLHPSATGCQLLLGIPIGVDGGKALPLIRQVFERKDGGNRTNRDTCTTIDAF
jgi:hypothetical protein